MNAAVTLTGYTQDQSLDEKIPCYRLFTIVLSLIDATTAAAAGALDHKTQNIIFVMTDGLRWQEVFSGAEASLMTKENGAVTDVEGLQRAYWRDNPQERRRALMPFLWNVVAKNGQIYGNRNNESDAFVTNGLNFSYPGYSETLCGFPDPRVNSNDKVPNPNVTVLEWLNRKSRYRGKVAAFGAWDVFPFIFNAERAQFPVNAGYEPFISIPISPLSRCTLQKLTMECLVTPRLGSRDVQPFSVNIEAAGLVAFVRRTRFRDPRSPVQT